MALNKTIIAQQGYATNYHKISELNLNNDNLSFLLESYVSEEFRQLEQPAACKSYFFQITIEEEESMGIRQLAYKKLKELNTWADAIDC